MGPKVRTRASRNRSWIARTGSCCSDIKWFCDKKFVSTSFQSNTLSLSICPKQRSLTLMWHSKYKMWRARPSLSGATCPAGSKTSCCESFTRALLSLNLLFHSLLRCSVICFSSSSLVFFHLTPSTLSLLHPLSTRCLSRLFLSIYISNICFILFFISSPLMHFLLASDFSALALSQPLFSPLSLVLNVALWSSSTQPPPLVSFCKNCPLFPCLLMLPSRHLNPSI